MVHGRRGFELERTRVNGQAGPSPRTDTAQVWRTQRTCVNGQAGPGKNSRHSKLFGQETVLLGTGVGLPPVGPVDVRDGFTLVALQPHPTACLAARHSPSRLPSFGAAQHSGLRGRKKQNEASLTTRHR